jgi:hypothetical protein
MLTAASLEFCTTGDVSAETWKVAQFIPLLHGAMGHLFEFYNVLTWKTMLFCLMKICCQT